MSQPALVFNPPPGWPIPPKDWQPPAGWKPDPSWPELPEDWNLWLPESKSDEELNEEPNHSPQTGSPIEVDRIISPYESDNLIQQLELLRSENTELKEQLEQHLDSSGELVLLNDEMVLQNVGIYRYHHPLENAADYKDRLADLVKQISILIKANEAIEKSNMFAFDNSLAKGKKMSADLGKLMLRAYNAEADNSIRSLRAGTVSTAKKRLEASRNSIAKLGSMMEMRISEEFHALRLAEIELTSDWLMKKQEEKEAAKEERARLREERRVEKELAEQREKLDKERAHILKTISSLKELGETNSDLESRLRELDQAITENDFRLANIRAGYVYVISNRGAFGENVVKIGLTRRLEPLERINELSGASVPFRFDVHALYFSEDAVSLENELHKHFATRAVNMANSRKEFFFATPSEIRTVLMDKVGNLLEFTEKAEATEFLQSTQYWPDSTKGLGPNLPM